jgi:Tol biopolymer transport system component
VTTSRNLPGHPDEVDEIIAYSTEQKIFTAPPDGGSSTQVTPDPIINQGISDFSWAPDSSRIAYRADQRADGLIELFAVRPDGSDNLRISGTLTNGGNVTDFVWSPDSGFIAYRANQDSVAIFELYVTAPDDNSRCY